MKTKADEGDFMKTKTVVKIFMLVIILTAIILTILAFTALPKLAEFSASTYKRVAHLATPVRYYVLLTAIPFYLILFNTFKICDSIYRDKIFSQEPSICLKKISFYAFIISIMYILLLLFFYYNKFSEPLLLLILGLIIFAALSVALFAKIMYILIVKACYLQKEHDLTI
ncbi:MAG: DUF2975 domain-containing protein [Tissierellia bacterium]|nr:DUF2975 domain-containing protein [Tissierellia bacterium]